MSTNQTDGKGVVARKASRKRTLTPSTAATTRTPVSREIVLWDDSKGGVPGFGLRILPTGGRSFILRVRATIDGKERQILRTVGKVQVFADPSHAVDPCGVLKARDKAREMFVDATRKQIDPKAKKSEAVVERSAGDAFIEWLKRQSELRKIRESTLAEYSRLWQPKRADGAAKVLEKKPVRSVTREDIEALHLSLLNGDGKKPRPFLANRTVRMLSAFFTWCEPRKYRDRHSNPCFKIDVAREDTNAKRSLLPDEYARLGRAFDLGVGEGFPLPVAQQKNRATTPEQKRHVTAAVTARRESAAKVNPVIHNALLFLTVTGWREREALDLKWEEVITTQTTSFAYLASTKSGASTRALGKRARDILARQRAQQAMEKEETLSKGKAWSAPVYVFQNRHTQKPIREIRYVWQSVKLHAGIVGRLRLHDLRHSFVTVSRECEFDDSIIAHLIGHKIGGQTAKYGEPPRLYIAESAERVMNEIASRLGCETLRANA